MKPILRSLHVVLLFSVALHGTAAESAATAGLLDVRDFGAIADGTTVNTRAIQAAIDACSAQRAAGVLVAGGRYVTGTIYLKSFVTLQVAAGAELLGSTNISDYTTNTYGTVFKNEPHMNRCLIFARNAEHIGIEGGGVIDGRGTVQNFPNQNDPAKNRPMLIRLLECSSIRVRDVTLLNPAAWTSAWLYCSDIVVDGVTIQSRANHNGDGMDFDGCNGVRVSNCAFDTSDDCVCLQGSRPDRPCHDVAINNCVFVSRWAGIRIGLSSRCDFYDVTVNNCVFRDISDSGLKIQMCEGGTMRNMIFSNLVMDNVPRPVFMTFVQQRAGKDAPAGVAPMKALGNMMFSNLLIDDSACGQDSALIFVGLPGHPIENITLENIRFRSGGGGTAASANPPTLPDLTLARLGNWWPEYKCFQRTVPCSGVYAGHVNGLTIRDTVLETAAPDARPAIVCDDVSGLALDHIQVAATASAEPLVFLNNVRSDVLDIVRSTGVPRQTMQRAGGESSADASPEAPTHPIPVSPAKNP